MTDTRKGRSGNSKNMRLAKEGPWAECAMQITPMDCWAAADEIDALHAERDALLAERDALREQNASLWERVKRWEPMADKSQWGCGGTTSATAAKGES